MPPGRPISSKDSTPRNRRTMTDNEYKLRTERKEKTAKAKAKANQKSKEIFLKLMSKELRCTNEEKEENESTEDSKAIHASNILEDSEIEVVNNNNYVELDGYIKEVEVEDGNDGESGIDTEVEFSYEEASIYNDYLKKLKERV